jgi:hypothetical protein
MTTDLRALVDRIGERRAFILETAPGLVGQIDQASAEACEELSREFGIDLEDPTTAHVAAAVVTYVVNKGRHAIGDEGSASQRNLRKLRGMELGATAIGAAVFTKHRGAP